MVGSIIRAYRSAFSGLSREIWLLCAVLLVNRAGTMVLPFLSLFLIVERGLTVAQAGQLLALYGIGAVLGAYLGGVCSDRFGSVRTQHLSLILTGAAFLWFVTLERLVFVSLGMFVLAMVSEAFRPAAMAAVAERSPAHIQVRSFALLRLAANIGMAIGPAVGGLLAIHSYRWLFIADAATCWAASLALLAALGTPGVTAAATAARGDERPRSPLTDGPFLLLLLLVTSIAVVLFQIFSTLPIHFREVYGFRENGIGMLLGLNATLIIAFEMVLIHAIQQMKRLPLIGLGAFIFCAGLGLMPLGSSVPYVALTVVVWTIGEMLCMPLLNAVVAERARSGNHGRYMGAYTMSFSVALIVGPTFGTWIFQHFGPRALWFSVGALGLPLWAFALFLSRILPGRRRRVLPDADDGAPV
jgi:MFS family permease